MDSAIGIKNLVIKGFDEYSKRKHLISLKPEDYEFVSKFKPFLKNNAKILDIGCGNGNPMAPLLIDAGFDYTGIDISEGQLKLAKLLNPKGKFFNMDMLEMNFPKEYFDCLLCLNSINHVPMYYHPRLIKSFFEILKPGGVLLITLGISEKEEIRTFFEEIPMYYSHYDLNQNINMIIESKFKILTKPALYYSSSDQILIFAKKPGQLSEDIEYPTVKKTENIIYDANSSLPTSF